MINPWTQAEKRTTNSYFMTVKPVDQSAARGDSLTGQFSQDEARCQRGRACLMLDHVGKKPTADRTRRAVDQVIRTDSLRTRDLDGNAKTKDFTCAIIKRLK